MNARKEAIITEHPQFFTATILEWKKLLKPDKYKDIVIESLKFLVESKRIKLFAFVLFAAVGSPKPAVVYRRDGKVCWRTNNSVGMREIIDKGIGRYWLVQKRCVVATNMRCCWCCLATKDISTNANNSNPLYSFVAK